MTHAIEIAELRTRITLRSPTQTLASDGAQQTSYADVATVWAKRVNAHGQEAVGSDALRSVQRATLTIRHYPGILPSWRVQMDEAEWDIVSLDNITDRNQWVELVVERTKGSL